MRFAGIASSARCVRRSRVALLAGSLWLFPALAQDKAKDEAKDLLFNCRLAGVKRVYIFNSSRGKLIDQGNEHPAPLRTDSLQSEWQHAWSAHTRMRHRVHIGRLDGELSYRVDELDESGEVLSQFVLETGRCSREKIHPRHFK